MASASRPETGDRARYPELRERIGEDPARYLDPSISLNPIPRIRGINDVGVANAWVQVARDLDVDHRIVDAVERRRDGLIEQEV